MKYENEMFQDLMGIVIETDNEWLDKKLNGHICYKGGGSSTSTSVATIPEEFKPFARGYAARLNQASYQNKFGGVGEEAKALKDAQQMAINRASEIQETGQAVGQANLDALQGTGMFAAQDFSAQKDALSSAARNRLGMQTAGLNAQSAVSGGGSGARAALARQQAEALAGAQLGGQLAQLDAQDLARRQQASQQAVQQAGMAQKAGMADIDILRGVGKEQTDRLQFLADAPTKGLREEAALFSGIPMGQTTTQSGGGGK